MARRGGGRGSSNLRVCGRNLKCSGPFIDRKLFGVIFCGGVYYAVLGGEVIKKSQRVTI